MKLLIVVASTILAVTPAWAESTMTTASATLRNADGKDVGQVILDETPNGVLVRAHFSDLPPGTHGFHIHAIGKCEPPFKSAGGHYNPTNAHHGFNAKGGPHAGDMPNLIVPASGKVEADFFLDGVKLDDGDKGVLDSDGAAIVVHANADDYHSDPAGNAGPRIACGVVKKRTGPAEK